MLRLGLILALLAAACAIFAWAAAPRVQSPAIGADSDERSPLEESAALDAAASDERHRARVLAEPLVAPDDSSAVASPAMEAEVGNLTGRLFDLTGKPMPRHRLVSAAPNSERVLYAATDTEGRFTFADVPAGVAWVAHEADNGGSIGYGLTILGEAVVPAGGTAHLDIYLRELRTLSGAFTLQGHDGVGLALELRDFARPELVVARGLAVSASTQALDDQARVEHFRRFRPEVTPDEVEAEIAAERTVERPVEYSTPGFFRMRHLRPAAYTLRVALEGEASARFYEDIHVDLIDGDVELPPREFTIQELFKGPFTEEELRRAK